MVPHEGNYYSLRRIHEGGVVRHMITDDDNIFMLLSYLQVRSKQCHLLIVPVIALNCSLVNQGIILSKVDLRDDKGFIT